MLKKPDPDTVSIGARIPVALQEILIKKTQELGIEFENVAGDYILKGVESERQKGGQ